MNECMPLNAWRLSLRVRKPNSSGPGPDQHDGDRPPHNFQIQPQGPIVNVFQVQPHPVPEIGDLLRPLTCHKQVRPGFTLSRRRCARSSNRLTSSTGSGRGPTRLISPRRH